MWRLLRWFLRVGVDEAGSHIWISLAKSAGGGALLSSAAAIIAASLSRPIDGWSALQIGLAGSFVLFVVQAYSSAEPKRHELQTQRDTPTPISPALPGEIHVNAAPKEVAALYNTHTTYQADQLFDAYKGKYMTVSAKFDDLIGGSAESSVMVCVDKIDGIEVYMWFDSEWVPRLSHLRKGEPIAVCGSIERAHPYGVTLKACRLVD